MIMTWSSTHSNDLPLSLEAQGKTVGGMEGMGGWLVLPLCKPPTP